MSSKHRDTVNLIPIFLSKYLWRFVYYTIVTSDAILGHCSLINAILKDPLKCFRNATSYFVFNLTVSDLLTSLVFMEETLIWLTKLGSIHKLPKTWKILNSYVFEVVLFTNVPSIFGLALERCLGIVFPLWHSSPGS